MPKNHGLTLIEILGSIAVIVILGLFSIPLMKDGGNKVRLKSSLQAIKTYAEFAKQYATNKRASYDLKVNLDDNQVYIEDTATGTMVNKIWSAPSLVDIVDVSDANGTNNDSGIQSIHFLANGKIEFAGAQENDVFIHFMIKGTKINGGTYNATSNYTAGNPDDPKERVKCHTVLIEGTSAQAVPYNFGYGDPWDTDTL